MGRKTSSHEDLSSFLFSPHTAVAAHTTASLARLAATHARPHPSQPRLPAPPRAPLPLPPSCLLPRQGHHRARFLRPPLRPCRLTLPAPRPPLRPGARVGADGACTELTQQAARMVAEGVDGVVRFLRPFMMFAVVRKGDATFVRDLIAALAVVAAAAVNPDSAVLVLKLLVESLLHFGRGDGEEVRLWLSSVECLVDAYVVLLRKLAHAQMWAGV